MSDSLANDDLQSRPENVEERRKSQRRSGHDQRDMIRFELEKIDRRSGKDRRVSNALWGSNALI